jgi:hypothetical protein
MLQYLLLYSTTISYTHMMQALRYYVLASSYCSIVKSQREILQD